MTNDIKKQLLLALAKTESYTSEVTVLHILNESLSAEIKSELYKNPWEHIDNEVLEEFKKYELASVLKSGEDGVDGDSRFTWLEHVFNLGIQNELIRCTTNARYNPYVVGKNKQLYEAISNYRDHKLELYDELSVANISFDSNSDEKKEETEFQFLLVHDVFNNTVDLHDGHYNIHTLMELLGSNSESLFKDLVKQLPEPFIEQLKLTIINNNIGDSSLSYDETLITFIQTLTTTMAMEWPSYTTNQKINALTFITNNINLENFEYKINFLSKNACDEFKSCINHIKKTMALGCELNPELCVSAVMSTLNISDVKPDVEF